MTDLFDLENTVAKAKQQASPKIADSQSYNGGSSTQNTSGNRLLAVQQELERTQLRQSHFKVHQSDNISSQLSLQTGHGEISRYSPDKGVGAIKHKSPKNGEFMGLKTVKFKDDNISGDREKLIKKGTLVKYRIETTKIKYGDANVVGKSLKIDTAQIAQRLVGKNGIIMSLPGDSSSGKIKQTNGTIVSFKWENLLNGGQLKIEYDDANTRPNIRKYTQVSYRVDPDSPNKVAGKTLEFRNAMVRLNALPILLERQTQLERYLSHTQGVGFELECADFYLNGVKGVTNHDTYGDPIISTTHFASKIDEGLSLVNAADRLPVIQVVLEERKGGADPHIEVVTAPFHERGLLRQLKNYINNTVLATANGNTAGTWAAAIPTPGPQITTLYHAGGPAVPGVSNQVNLAWQQDPGYPVMFNNLRLAKKKAGARLIQCNVDLFLDQFYLAPAFIRSMIHGKSHLKFYNAAWRTVDAWKHTYQNLLRPNDPRHHVAGLLTYALYQAFAARAYGGNSKEFVQPLIKCGVDVLARVGLNAAERGLLLDIANFVVNGYDAATSAAGAAPVLGALAAQTARRNELMTPLNKELEGAFSVDEDGLEKDDLEGPLDDVRFSFATWFLVKQEVTKIISNNVDRGNATDLVSLYPGGPTNEQLRNSGINDNQDLDNWIDDIQMTDSGDNLIDLYDSSRRVRTLGDSVDWDGERKGGATTAGKHLKPRLHVAANKTIVVVEVRKSEAKFNKRMYHNL
ncbi:hypothetical protein QGP82_12635 [Leptothoe sp. LEGE 181152]|nr:hypothetical protein [Leptothoe sp. LEGE 181152]